MIGKKLTEKEVKEMIRMKKYYEKYLPDPRRGILVRGVGYWVSRDGEEEG